MLSRRKSPPLSGRDSQPKGDRTNTRGGPGNRDDARGRDARRGSQGDDSAPRPIRGGGGGRSVGNAGDGGCLVASRNTSRTSTLESTAAHPNPDAEKAAGASPSASTEQGQGSLSRSTSTRMHAVSSTASIAATTVSSPANMNDDLKHALGTALAAAAAGSPTSSPPPVPVSPTDAASEGAAFPGLVSSIASVPPPDLPNDWPSMPAPIHAQTTSQIDPVEGLTNQTGSCSLFAKRNRKAGRPDKLEVPTRSSGGDGCATPGGTSSRGRAFEPLTPTSSAAPSRAGKEEATCSIRVVVRIRPPLSKEKSEVHGVEALSDGKSVLLTDGEQKKQFTVDEVIDSRPMAPMDGSQTTVYNSVGRDLLTQSMKGYNVCLFAYGHTGSGKTYTVLGVSSGVCTDGEAAGLLPRFLADIFRTNAQDPLRTDLRYRAEFYEVHNEQIRDLLAPVGGHRRRAIHVHPIHGVRIDGLSSAVVASAEEALGLVNFGNQMRTVATTTMNERSSRSHAVFTLNFEYTKEGDQGQRSAITFVDLAGREDWEATAGRGGEHYKEMCYINTSLFHLARLITKLSEGQVTKGSLADFRNSKLTLLLSQALIGNSRTALVATLAPLKSFYDDSVSTLNFAANVKKITTKPFINAKSGSALVKELEKEVLALRTQLNDAKTSSTEKEENLLAAQAMIQYYKTSFEDLMSQSEEQKQLRKSMTLKLGLPDTFEGDFSHPRTAGGQLVPFFTKLSDDPSLQGCCNYFLSRGVLVLGSDDSCDIMLHGVGVRPKMCEVKFDSASGTVTIQLLQSDSEDAPRVIVGGHPLKETSHEVHMSHNDSLVLGYAHAFRLVDPENDPSLAFMEGNGHLATSDLAQKLCPSLDMRTAVQDVYEETGSEFRKAYAYLQQFSARAPESAVQTFMADLRKICPLVDEANEIREQIYGRPDLRFELHCLTDFMDLANDSPELVVCTMQNIQSMRPLDKFKATIKSVLATARKRGNCGVDTDEGDAGGGTPGDGTPPLKPRPRRNMLKRRDTVQLLGTARHPMVHEMGLASHMEVNRRAMLYVWSLEKFLRRLKEMRELYQEGCEAKDGFESVRKHLESKPYLNPWREMTIGDVKLIAEDARCYSIMGAHHHHQVSRLSSGKESKNGDETPRACLTPRGPLPAEPSPRAGSECGTSVATLNNPQAQPLVPKVLVSPPANSAAGPAPSMTTAPPVEPPARAPAVTTVDVGIQAGGGEVAFLTAVPPAEPEEPAPAQETTDFSLAEAVKGALEVDKTEAPVGTSSGIGSAMVRRSRVYSFGARDSSVTSLNGGAGRRVQVQGGAGTAPVSSREMPRVPERPPKSSEREEAIFEEDRIPQPAITAHTISASTFGDGSASQEVECFLSSREVKSLVNRNYEPAMSPRNNSKSSVSSKGSRADMSSLAFGSRPKSGTQRRPPFDVNGSPRELSPGRSAVADRDSAIPAGQLPIPKIKISQREFNEIRRELGACRADAMSDPEACRLGTLLDRFEQLLSQLGAQSGYTDSANASQVAIPALFSTFDSLHEDPDSRPRSPGRSKENESTSRSRAASAGPPAFDKPRSRIASPVAMRTIVSRSRSPVRFAYQVVKPVTVQLPLSAAATAAALGPIAHRSTTPVLMSPAAKTAPVLGKAWQMVPVPSPEGSFRQASPPRDLAPCRSFPSHTSPSRGSQFAWPVTAPSVASVTTPQRKFASPTLLRPRGAANERGSSPGGDSGVTTTSKFSWQRKSIGAPTSGYMPSPPTEPMADQAPPALFKTSQQQPQQQPSQRSAPRSTGTSSAPRSLQGSIVSSAGR